MGNEVIENVIMIILGSFIILCGAFLVFGAASGKLNFNKAPKNLRVRIGIIGGVLAAIGVVLIITVLTGDGLIFSANG